MDVNQSIGEIAITFSLLIYFVRYIPQLIYNGKYKKTDRISLWTQIFMLMANTFDAIYGFGFDLPWQYKVVALASIVFLLIEQYQIRPSLLMPSGIFVALALPLGGFLSPYNLIALSGVSGFLYLVYWFPQMYKNWTIKAGNGISKTFIICNILALSCDLISSWFLDFPVTSRYMPLIFICLNLIIYLQSSYYSKITIANRKLMLYYKTSI